jgi:excisionase family DNA binding protein
MAWKGKARPSTVRMGRVRRGPARPGEVWRGTERRGTDRRGKVWTWRRGARKPREAAKYAKVSVGTLYREVREGRLRAARIGGRRELRFRPAWIDEWLENWATPVEEPKKPRGIEPK